MAIYNDVSLLVILSNLTALICRLSLITFECGLTSNGLCLAMNNSGGSGNAGGSSSAGGSSNAGGSSGSKGSFGGTKGTNDYKGKSVQSNLSSFERSRAAEKENQEFKYRALFDSKGNIKKPNYVGMGALDSSYATASHMYLDAFHKVDTLCRGIFVKNNVNLYHLSDYDKSKLIEHLAVMEAAHKRRVDFHNNCFSNSRYSQDTID